jgi:hypothetical protein
MFTLVCSMIFAGLGANAPACADETPYLCRCCRGADGCLTTQREPYLPQPGDLFFGWSGNFLAKAGYIAVRAGPPSHNGMIVRLPDGELAVLEATTTEPQYGDEPGVFLRPALFRLRTYQGPVWIRQLRCPLTPEESQCLTQFALEQVGKPFAKWRSILIAPFTRPTKGPLCARLTGPAPLNRDKWFCSELLITAGIIIGRFDACRVKPMSTDPRDMFLDRSLDLSRDWKKPLRLCW